MSKPDLARRLDEIQRRYALPPGSGARLERLLADLVADSQAPTAVKDPVAAIDVHLADSLCALEVAGLRQCRRIVDLGSGAGFPGIALAVAMPESRFDLLEASHRKCAFLERAIDGAQLQNARVICARAEEWGTNGGASSYDAATARALAPLPVVLEYSAPLLEVGGRLLAWKGRRDRPEEEAAIEAASVLGLELVTVEPVEPFAGSRHRHIHVYEKLSATPARFPRRSGIARKRPLGGRRLAAS